MGLAVGLRYLMGWALATHPANREQPEWPPHPDRIYMALAAAYFEEQDIEERRALEWLEKQSPPALYVARGHGRKVTTSYVPVNDTQMPRWKAGTKPSDDQLEAGLSLLPTERNKQARQFPTVLLEDETLYIEWGDSPDQDNLAALRRLCQKVTRVGHSASLTQMWVADAIPDSSVRRKLVATEKIGSQRLRTVSEGRLKSLAEAFAAGRRPPTATYQAYEEARAALCSEARLTSEFSDELLVLSASSQSSKFGLTSTLLLTQTLRKLFLSKCSDPIPEWISGHLNDGGRSEQTHLAMVPLAHVGRAHASGHLLGLALVVPRVHTDDVARALGKILLCEGIESAELRLTLGLAGEWTVSLEQRDEVPQTLQPQTWTAAPHGARTWATITPFVLDRHSKGRHSHLGTETAIRAACSRIGLPEPESVETSKTSLFEGTPSIYEFPSLLRKDGSNRHHTHCIIQFAEPVVGPVIIGAGRYRGYGFCRPLRERKDGNDD